MKRLLGILLAGILALGGAPAVYAAEDSGVSIVVDGAKLKDAQAVLENGTTLLPVRSVSTALGGDVTWDAATETVIVEKGATRVVMPVGEKYIIVNETMKELTTPAQVLDGRTYVPLRVLGEALNCEIVWENTTKTVKIQSVTEKEDIFGESTGLNYVDVNAVYLTEGETVVLPVYGGNWIRWSNNTKVECEWGWYKDQQVIYITGKENGTCSLQIYESDSQKGLKGDNDYIEIKAYVVNENNKGYQKQKQERIAAGMDLQTDQQNKAALEEQLKNELGLAMKNVYDNNFINENGTLILPIETKEYPMAGTIEVNLPENSHLNVQLGEYAGEYALFFRGDRLEYADVMIRYITTQGIDDGGLNLDVVRSDDAIKEWRYEVMDYGDDGSGHSYFNLTLADMRISVVYDSNKNFKNQEAERQENGISYDWYLNGLA